MDQNRKTTDKWVSAILSIILPGVGHFYLGYAGRGLIIIGALIIDIALIVFASLTIFVVFPVGIALATLLSLVLPVIYFFSIFDVLQMAERKHADAQAVPVTGGQPDWRSTVDQEVEWPEEIHDMRETSPTRGSYAGSSALGIVLIIIGVVLMIGFLLPSSFIMWLFSNLQVLFAVVLLTFGGWLIWRQWDRKKGDHS